MLTWLKIGLRNIAKNRRRSLFTLGAIAFGFAAINLLGGFTDYVFRGLEASYVYAAGNGHLSVFKQGYLSEGALRPTDYLLSDAELTRIKQICADDERILISTEQLNISGLVSNGAVSTIMMAEGRVPADVRAIRDHGAGFIRKLQLFDGQSLDADSDAGAGVGLAKGLADKLQLRLGDDAVVVAPTVDGYMNALDARVMLTFDAPLDILDNLMMAVTLDFARSLYDTGGADRVNLLLSDARLAPRVKSDLTAALAAAGLETEIESWDRLQYSYLRIRDMFNVIFGFVFIIVFIIVVLSVVNTVSMAVMERTRETGTLRALGLKRRGVIIMFATESAILAGLGNLAGLGLTLCGWLMIRWAKPTWIPPNIPKRVPLEVHLVPEYLLWTFLCLLLLAVIAAIVPARRAARMSIIDALGHT